MWTRYMPHPLHLLLLSNNVPLQCSNGYHASSWIAEKNATATGGSTVPSDCAGHWVRSGTLLLAAKMLVNATKICDKARPRMRITRNKLLGLCLRDPKRFFSFGLNKHTHSHTIILWWVWSDAVNWKLMFHSDLTTLRPDIPLKCVYNNTETMIR